MANKKSIKILRGGPNYDPSISEEILLDGQLFYSKKTRLLYIGDGVTQLRNLTPISDPNFVTDLNGKVESINTKNITISEDIYTAYSIGSITASLNDRKKLFSKGANLHDSLEAIFDVTQQPTKTLPNLTLSVNPTSVTGEIGSDWPTINTSTSTTTGSYSYGPATGVTWNDNLNITSSGNTSGKFGSGERIYTATQSYNAATVSALDNKGNLSNPEIKIEAGTDTATATVNETVQYRAFFGSSTNVDVDALLASLKIITNNTAEFNTSLITSNPSTATLPIVASSYLYIISHYNVDTSKIKDDNTGFEVAFESLGIKTFTNSHNAGYSVYVYRSLNTFNAGSVTLRLS